MQPNRSSSTSFFEILALICGPRPYAPGPYYDPGIIYDLEELLKVKYAPVPHLKSTLLQEHRANMFLEQCAFQIWSWSIFDSGNSSRLLMVQGHMVLEHKHGPGP